MTFLKMPVWAACLSLLLCGCGDNDQARPSDLGPVDLAVVPDAAADMATPIDLMPMCTLSTQCPDAMPVCKNGMCQACASVSDNALCAQHSSQTPYCQVAGTNIGKCVACTVATQATDCSGATPACGSDGACRKCQAHSECASQVCNLDGTCAATTDVVYANNNMTICSETVHTSTAAAPYCEIQTALANIGSKSIVRAYGSAVTYAKLNIGSGTVSIVGPSADPTTCATPGSCAKLSGDSSNPAISISGGSTVVVLDGIEVTGGSAGQDGVSCLNSSVGSTVTIQRSYIHGVVGGNGIATTKCKLTVTQSTVSGNTGGAGISTSGGTTTVTQSTVSGNTGGPGITTNGGTLTLDRDLIATNSGGGLSTGSNANYQITNCFVTRNLSTNQAGVSLNPGGSDAMHVFQHNTVAYNTNTGGIGGINVQSGTAKLENSIVVHNSLMGNSQLSAASTFMASYMDVDDASAPAGNTNRTTEPTFVNPTTGPNYDYHLTDKADNGCCVDQVPTSPVDHDYDGRSRPQPVGGMFDIGAHEVPQP
jgi:hypothetical protein